MWEEQEPADGAVRVGLWVVKEPRAKEHAPCLLGLGLTFCMSLNLWLPLTVGTKRSGQAVDQFSLQPPTLAGWDKRVTSSGQVLLI